MRALVLTGGLGAGKTATAVAVGEALERDGVAGAVVDLDWLCWAWSRQLDDAGVHALLCRNLAAIVPNLAASGADSLVLARGVLEVSELAALRTALAGIPVSVVRLVTTRDEARARLAARDTGAQRDEHLAELESFEARVAAAAGDAPVVDTTGRGLPDVAAEVLRVAGWA
jgi:hypothetical protein